MIRHCFILASLAALLLASCTSVAPYTYDYIPGKSAVIKDGIAVVPETAPAAVKRAIEAGNRLQGKPYIYGGGHRKIEDIGYDCSGTVSYVLYHSGFIKETMASDEYRRYGKAGKGDWLTIYARRGHVFMSIAGLRLDTGYHGEREGPRWSTLGRPANGCVLRHPDGL